jgi:TrmH family RNA methyltransferase
MISSPSNPTIKRIRQLQSRRKTRQESRSFVIEGLRLLREAAETGAAVELVLHTDHLDERGRALVNTLARQGASVEIVSPPVMKVCSTAETPPGLLAVLPFPDLKPPQKLTLALVVDGLADPGNLGTLLRTAMAAGVEVVFLTEGTVDAFNPKVVRGGMGAHLRLPLVEVDAGDLGDRLHGLEVWVAEPGGGVPYDRVDWRKPSALVIGGEAHGPHAEVRSLAKGRVSILMPGEAESLNASIAGAIILFEIVRQRGRT